MRRLLLLLVIASCDTVEDRPPTWSYVHAAIIAPSCATASCHSKISSVAGRDLSTRTSAYAMLTGRTCDAPPRPGEPGANDSILLLRTVLTGSVMDPAKADRLQMPPDQRLPDVEIELIERWIDAGWPCD